LPYNIGDKARKKEKNMIHTFAMDVSSKVVISYLHTNNYTYFGFLPP